MKTSKKTTIFYFIFLSMLFFSSCKDNNPTPTPTPTTSNGKKIIPVYEPITESTTWTNENRYLIKGNVYVVAGAELTIQAGTTIFGDKLSKGALIVCRGAKIHANGTASAPIVFTSAASKGFRNSGDWGGVVILGRSPNNQSNDQSIEGISAPEGDSGKYGGTIENDNSGEFTYVRIEYAGVALSPDNELNCLTFGSVGSGTTIHHVQVSFGGDDSFEWFGGSVNTKYLVAYSSWDDDFDTDFGYRGKNQFLASFRNPNLADKSGSCSFESDNDGSGSGKTPLTSAVFSNVTSFGPWVFAPLNQGNLSRSNANANFTRGAHIRRNSALKIYNSVIVGWGAQQGVYFDKTNADAAFKSNYLARTLGNVKEKNEGTLFDDSKFDNDNFIQEDQSTVDLSAILTGMTGSMNIANLTFQPSPNSILLSSKTITTDGLEQTSYIGAFDGNSNWMEGWTNFDPQNTDY